ncbi:MAG TPA: hypothetical protein VGG99_18380 [Acetobacteraceae bacterium]|jgi:hypothetical protein
MRPTFPIIVRRLALGIALAVPLHAMAHPAAPQPGPPPSPDAAAAQVQAWLAERLGPHAAADLRIHVTPEDDHLRVAAADPLVSGEAEATAALRPGPNGRWVMDRIRIPAATFTLPGPRGPAAYAFSIGAQDSHAVVDPALAAPSSLDLDLSDMGLTSNGPGLHQAEHVGRLAVHARLTPHGDRLDFDQQTTLAGWHSASRVSGKVATVAADQVQASSHIGGLDHRHAEALLAAVAGLLATLPADAAAAERGAPLPAPAHAAVLAWIDALRGPVADTHGAETVNGLTVTVAGQGEAHVRQMRMAADFSAARGLVHGWFDVSIDGLHVSGLPKDEAALVPTRIALHPTVAGVRLADLTTLMQEATEPGASPDRLRNDAQTLLMHPGVTLGMESISLTLGPATLFGHGHVTLTEHDGYAIDAHFIATGFDTLMAQAATNPAMRRSLPVLAVMRGFARQEGNRLAWDVTEHNGALTVNGIPLSANDQADSR